MTFPSGPSGSGFPEQPDFSQQPSFGVQPPIFSHQPGFGHPPEYPQQSGYPGSPQAAPPSGPSGATAITAAVLALLGGLFGVFFGAVGAAVMVSDGDFDAMGVVLIVFGIAFGLALFNGAVLLLRRRMIGRWLIVGGCAVAILLGLAVFADMLLGISGAPSHDPAAFGAIALPGFVFPIATTVLVLLPSTTSWIDAVQDSQNPAPQVHSPFQGYPPHQGYQG